MLQKLPVINFEWIKVSFQLNEDFIKYYNEKCDERYFFDSDAQHPEKLYEVQNDLRFLLERMKIEKVEKVVPNLHDKTECVIHMRKIEKALDHGLVLKKVHKVITFNQNARLK